MALQHYLWSRTAASNATADAAVNWTEGQAPSTVNDSARAMMASAAGFRDDIAGAIVTGGTSTAYTVATYQVFDSLAHLNGQVVAFSPHATNGATVTLNVDGLGAKPLRSAPSVELPAGVLVQGTPYVALYNSSDSAFYLSGFYTSPYIVPIGACIDYFGSSAPNSSFVLPYGQAISRSTYSALFSLFGTTYGAGDGSNTFNVPDLRGRIIAGKDDMGGSAASRLTSTYYGTSAAALGAVGGSESKALTVSQIPTLTSTGTVTLNVNPAGYIPVSSGSPGNISLNSVQSGTSSGHVRYSGGISGSFNSLSGFNSMTTTETGGATGTAHSIVPPTIIANKLLRII